MAITIVATAGSATANSYLTLADADSIIEGLVASDDVAAWDGSTTDNTNADATAASIAFPPFDRISVPAFVAKGCAVDTTPFID